MRKPPLIPYIFLKVLAPSEIREFFLGDIEEQFQLIVEDQNEQDANLWFWKQTVNSIFPLLGLFAQKNLQLSIFRVFAVLAVLLPVILTSPLKDSGPYYSLSELFALLFAAFVLGFLCRLIIKNFRFVTTAFIAIVIFTICLILRGEWHEIPWMLVPITLFVSVGAGLALIIPNKNSTDPKIRT